MPLTRDEMRCMFETANYWSDSALAWGTPALGL